MCFNFSNVIQINMQVDIGEISPWKEIGIDLFTFYEVKGREIGNILMLSLYMF